MPSINRNDLFSFYPVFIYFISCYYLILLCMTSNTTLNRRGREWVSLTFFQILWRKHSILITKSNVNSMYFIGLRKFQVCCKSWMGLSFVKSFLCIRLVDYKVCLLYSINVRNWIDRLSNIESTLPSLDSFLLLLMIYYPFFYTAVLKFYWGFLHLCW